jgi:hypothetical protein
MGQDRRSVTGSADAAQLERQRELESLIASERQSRLNMSDKLDEAAKVKLRVAMLSYGEHGQG